MARQDVLMEPQSPGSPASPDKPSAPELPEPYSEMRSLDEDAAVKPDRRTSSSSSSSSRASSAECVFHVDASEMHTPLVVAAAEGDDDHADAGTAAEAKLPAGDWVSWPEPSSDGGTVSAAPEAQTMAKPAVEGFNPDRIPASVFQPKAGSQADWSITSNESLFSIHGASLSTSDDFYAPSRSHFDYFYDEAMAAGGGGFQDGKLPPLAEVPGSAMSDASEGSASAKRGIRRHESGSIGSSSNFSFAFPMYTGRAVAGDEGEHGRLPAAAEGAGAVAADALEPQVAVRGDDDGGGAAAAQHRVVLVRGVLRLLLVRLLLAHLLLPMAVAVLFLLMLLANLLPVQLVPLRGDRATRNGGKKNAELIFQTL
ncbi:hypothetical protein D1007_21628 [Hordeum vulgare]|nr:hypothetical protein D1007_21628 [Hordeum vulgare]